MESRRVTIALQPVFKSRGVLMAQATLSIGEVARQVGLKTSAIRFYEKHGVMPEPERQSGQRRYTDDAVRRLRVLDIAKRAGFEGPPRLCRRRRTRAASGARCPQAAGGRRADRPGTGRPRLADDGDWLQLRHARRVRTLRRRRDGAVRGVRRAGRAQRHTRSRVVRTTERSISPARRRAMSSAYCAAGGSSRMASARAAAARPEGVSSTSFARRSVG